MAINGNRSTDPQDYQDLPQAIGVMSKNFAEGFVIPFHEHARDQLLYATAGIMRLRTAREAWIVPRDSAVYIPAGTHHAVSMHGAVEMRTLAMSPPMTRATPAAILIGGWTMVNDFSSISSMASLIWAAPSAA